VTRPRILITGAGGFCGQHACRRFAAGGYAVTAVLRDASAAKAEALAGIGAELELEGCDLTNRQEVERLIARVRPDLVLHLAGLNAVGPSWADPVAFLEGNAMATAYVLEGVRSLDRPCRVVVAGSMLRFDWPAADAPPRPPHPYSLSKTMQVALARSWHSLYGVDVIVAEPGNLIGPGPSTGLCALIAGHVRKLREAERHGTTRPAAFRLSSRTERRDFLDARDAVAAYELLMAKGEAGRVYPIASGRFRTLQEVAEAFERAAGFAIEWEIGDSPGASPEPVELSAIASLGWRPAIPFDQSVSDMLAPADERSTRREA